MPANTHRQAAIRKARHLLEKQPLFLDTETTGLDARAEIVEICVLEHDGVVLIDSLVRPTAPVPAEAARVHRITNEMLQTADSWPRVWLQVSRALTGRQVAIYNADYDVRLLKQSHRAHGLPWRPGSMQSVCIMQLYAQFHGQWNPRHRSFTWKSLEDARRALKLNLPNAHRARDDAKLARAVLFAIAETPF